MLPVRPELAANRAILLPDLLTARECRQARQTAWLARHATTLISFTVISPGPIKDSVLTRRIFNRGWHALLQHISVTQWSIREQAVCTPPSGPEGFLALAAPANEVKQATILLEEGDSLGRLWDIDVFDQQGKSLSRRDTGRMLRPCLLCSRPAAICARERAHPLPALLARMEEMFDDVG